MGDLLLRGPQPPLSHFGVTLLRHAMVTGLRYSLYHLGLPLPVRAPIRIESLRLELDPSGLRELLADGPEGRAVLGALVEPGGAEGDDEKIPAGVAFFHRQRLRWARRRRPARLEPPPDASATALEAHFREQLTRALPGLNDAVLDEILAAMRRRRRRRQGAALPPCLGAEAAAWVAGGRPRLQCLGAPDPLVPSWADETPEVEPPSELERARRSRDGRGRFRELYRRTLDGLRPTLAALGARATRDGVIEHPDDLFFLPFELLGDLTGTERPAWLDAATLRNRSEYFGLLREATAADRQAWAAAPLRPFD